MQNKSHLLSNKHNNQNTLIENLKHPVFKEVNEEDELTIADEEDELISQITNALNKELLL